MPGIDQFEERLKNKFQETIQYFTRYVKNPMVEIKTLPDWAWKHLIFVNILLAMSSGILAGLAALSVLRVMFGIFIFPIVSLLLSTLLTTFFYYYFQIFEKRTESFRRLMTLVIFANLPFFVFQIGADYLPPLTILGFAFTGFLLMIGLAENFKLDRKKSIQLILVLFLVIFSVWAWELIERQRSSF